MADEEEECDDCCACLLYLFSPVILILGIAFIAIAIPLTILYCALYWFCGEDFCCGEGDESQEIAQNDPPAYSDVQQSPPIQESELARFDRNESAFNSKNNIAPPSVQYDPPAYSDVQHLHPTTSLQNITSPPSVSLHNLNSNDPPVYSKIQDGEFTPKINASPCIHPVHPFPEQQLFQNKDTSISPPRLPSAPSSFQNINSSDPPVYLEVHPSSYQPDPQNITSSPRLPSAPSSFQNINVNAPPEYSDVQEKEFKSKMNISPCVPHVDPTPHQPPLQNNNPNMSPPRLHSAPSLFQNITSNISSPRLPSAHIEYPDVPNPHVVIDISNPQNPSPPAYDEVSPPTRGGLYFFSAPRRKNNQNFTHFT